MAIAMMVTAIKPTTAAPMNVKMFTEVIFRPLVSPECQNATMIDA